MAYSPRTPGPAWSPARARGKAHRRDHLGYAGRRVLVSRKWSGKTLADHRADHKAWLTDMLGLPATDPATYRWEPVQPSDENYLPSSTRLPSPTGSAGKRSRGSQAPGPGCPRRRGFGNREGGVMARSEVPPVERLFSVAQVAELLSTTERFPRRRVRGRRAGRHLAGLAVRRRAVAVLVLGVSPGQGSGQAARAGAPAARSRRRPRAVRRSSGCRRGHRRMMMPGSEYVCRIS
jgi:hypothetical protein